MLTKKHEPQQYNSFSPKLSCLGLNSSVIIPFSLSSFYSALFLFGKNVTNDEIFTFDFFSFSLYTICIFLFLFGWFQISHISEFFFLPSTSLILISTFSFFLQTRFRIVTRSACTKNRCCLYVSINDKL